LTREVHVLHNAVMEIEWNKPPRKYAPWTCLACGRVLARKSVLKTHMIGIHGAQYTLLDSKTRTGSPSQGDDGV